MSRKFVFLLASSRNAGVTGNSELLAKRAAEALPDSVEQEWIRLTDLPLDPFQDIRHEGDGVYPQPTGNEKVLLDATLSATDLVIVSPVYWYSLATPAKLYLDYWSAWLRVPGADFRAAMGGTTLWGVTGHATRDRKVAEPLIGTLELTADFMGMNWGGVLLGNGTRPGQVHDDEGALDEAAAFFGRAPQEYVAA
ncbi:flavodoxin family protein [Streptomyces hiroshimensis]|uniref:Flavodoxin n=1 Tax=Streptomyces hiroshimensis TaxID=66424 RepID=A0ABQ2YSJ1_9ACTN|nr:NAD(P)H-dependent oxidoreductase [Streptomyces hiroshimensis]GGX91935.1 flavodoxin [Streptomyces hiroshimensis]